MCAHHFPRAAHPRTTGCEKMLPKKKPESRLPDVDIFTLPAEKPPWNQFTAKLTVCMTTSFTQCGMLSASQSSVLKYKETMLCARPPDISKEFRHQRKQQALTACRKEGAMYEEDSENQYKIQ